MKKILIALCISVLTLSAGMSSVEAKRMGGGSSFGKKSQGISRQAPAQAAKPSTPAAAAAPSPWKGMLGGALLGLGLGALLSSMGLGGAMASMISTMLMIGLLAAAAMFIYRMYKRKTDTAANNARPAFSGAAAQHDGFAAARPMALQAFANDTAYAGSQAGASTQSHAAFDSTPADFDTQGFLRHSKTYFIRLQAAWDKADVNDIREFTTPEMFAELKMQIQERGATENHTDVMALEAELLGIQTLDGEHLASIKFSGMIKEDPQASAQAFNEIWNLSKPSDTQGGWILAGIEQI